MKFCMLTSFFGRHSFGGDAVYVDRLSRALLRRGHEVTVVYSEDAFQALRGSSPEAPYTKPDGLRLKPLRVPRQPFPLLLSHQLGRPIGMQEALREALGGESFDVLHFHNISMLGGPGILSMPVEGKPIRLMTAHEFWLVCERSVLWKNGNETCHEPACIECSLRAGRPPQWWRKFDAWREQLERLDLLLTPSEASAFIHAKRGLRRPMEVLPYFVGRDWLAEVPTPNGNAYFLFAGRLVREKGLAQAIEAMRLFPEVELWIAGSGPEEAALRGNAARNIRFLGRLGEAELRNVYRGAIATLIPSEMVETFGYVALESMAVGTPVVVKELGALPELVAQSGGGIVYTGVGQMREAMAQLLENSDLRARLGSAGRNAALRLWNEERHIEHYLKLLATVN